jgi:hypothetical protein
VIAKAKQKETAAKLATAREIVKKFNGPLPTELRQQTTEEQVESLRKENDGLKAELADLLRQQRDDYRALCVSISNAFANR